MAINLQNTTDDPTLDPIDLLLDANGDLDVTGGQLNFSRGLTAISQGIQMRLSLFQGEWFLNLDAGIPYYQDILGQKFDEIKIRDAFRTALLSSPGVTDILDLAIVYDGATRTVTVTWSVQTEFGPTPEDTLSLEI